MKVGEVVPAQEGGDVALGVGGEDADAVAATMESGKDFGHPLDGIHRFDPLMEKFQPPLGDPRNPPVADPEMADELSCPHGSCRLEFLAWEVLEAELGGEVVEDAVGDLEGVGHGSVKIKKEKLRRIPGMASGKKGLPGGGMRGVVHCGSEKSGNQ